MKMTPVAVISRFLQSLQGKALTSPSRITRYPQIKIEKIKCSKPKFEPEISKKGRATPKITGLRFSIAMPRIKIAIGKNE
jgi:hypothetical protein